MSQFFDINSRPDPDELIIQIADYVMDYEIQSDEAYETAKSCLIDTLGCGLLALSFPACTKLLGPVVEGTEVPYGCLLYTSPSPRDQLTSRMPSSA